MNTRLDEANASVALDQDPVRQTQYADWQDIETHSVYPEGAPLTRVACHLHPADYDASVADPTAWRQDRELIDAVADDLAKMCGSTRERMPKSRAAAVAVLTQCKGDAKGLGEAVDRLCLLDWFGRWALQVDPYALVGKIVAEYARGKPKAWFEGEYAEAVQR